MSQGGVPLGPHLEAGAPLGAPHVGRHRMDAALSGKALSLCPALPGVPTPPYYQRWPCCD